MLGFSMEGHFDTRVGNIGVWICVKAVLQGVIWTKHQKLQWVISEMSASFRCNTLRQWKPC